MVEAQRIKVSGSLLVFGLFILLSGGLLQSDNSFARTLPLISPEALKESIERSSDEILVIDTRPHPTYDLVHISGAINLPWSTEINIPEDLSYEKLLVLYCESSEGKEASEVAAQLQAWDYVRIRILNGGFEQWQKLGYPTERGSEGKSSSAVQEVRRITIDELNEMMAKGADVVILDVQTKSVYNKEHIKGAVSFPWKVKLTKEDTTFLPRNKSIVTYCDCGPGEGDSASVAAQLRSLGFSNVMVLKDPSVRGWKKAGHPMEMGSTK